MAQTPSECAHWSQSQLCLLRSVQENLHWHGQRRGNSKLQCLLAVSSTGYGTDTVGYRAMGPAVACWTEHEAILLHIFWGVFYRGNTLCLGCRSKKRRVEDVDDEHHGEFDANELRQHEEFTKVKNVDSVELGQYQMETWYFSPLPAEYNNCKVSQCRHSGQPGRISQMLVITCQATIADFLLESI